MDQMDPDQSEQPDPSSTEAASTSGPALPEASAGHWKASGHFFGKLIWNILFKILDLEEGGTGAGEGALPLYHPFKIQTFVYDFPYECSRGGQYFLKKIEEDFRNFESLSKEDFKIVEKIKKFCEILPKF